MRGLLKIIGNSALVVAGFFVVLFAASKASGHGSQGSALTNELGGGVAHADAPAADSASSASSGGDSGSDCGGDSGGGGK